MTDEASAKTLTLTVRRRIRASATRLFEAWTRPDQLKLWWGPGAVVCADAEIDLQVGGRYRITNRLPDGTLIVIVGAFEVVAPPHRLSYTWQLEPSARAVELVTIRFEPRGDATDVIVIHERIADAAIYATHDASWHGCLDGLADYVAPDGGHPSD